MVKLIKLKEAMIEPVTFTPLGKISTPYKEKFAIPRQPGIVTQAKGSISLFDEENNLELIRGIEQFSHLWLIFIFHGTQQQGWKPLVRPPRLGGNKKIGVLATRSTFRPNPIGMSAVKLDCIKTENNKVQIVVSGVDLLDQTPILDIKPYIPYSDAIYDAQAGFAQNEPENNLSISFNEQAKLFVHKYSPQYPELESLIEQVLAQDPRPAYKKNKTDDNVYGIRLYDFNIKWRLISASQIDVIEVALYS